MRKPEKQPRGKRPPKTPPAAKGAAAKRLPAATKREIDRLMAGPPGRQPSIIVIGDEAVFGVTPSPRKPR